MGSRPGSVYDQDPDTGEFRDHRSFENPPGSVLMPDMAATYVQYLDERAPGQTWEEWAAAQPCS